MGHLRLGEIPKTYRWRQLALLLDDQPEASAKIAFATAHAAEGRLRQLANDPSLSYCFWLLTRLTWAARGADFAAHAARLGIEVRPDVSTLEFVSQVSDVARSELSQHPESGPFGEIASLAMRRAFTETVGQRGRSLFGSTVEDLTQALRAYSSPRQFGQLAHRFFGDFLARTLRFYVDKELSNRVGPSHSLTNVAQAADFMDGLDTHARQTARIMEAYADDWYSKHNWESKGEISQSEAAGFVAHALRKLRRELRQEAATV